MTCDLEARKAAIGALENFVEEYVSTYELEADEGLYAPNETESTLILDAIQGLIADDEFLDLVAKVANSRERPRAQCAWCHGVGKWSDGELCTKCNGGGLEP